MHVQPRTGARIDMKRTLLSWSSGKDSAWSLYLLRNQTDCEVVGLLTTFNQEANRVAMHAVRRMGLDLKAYLKPFHEMGERHYDFSAIEKRFAHLREGKEWLPQANAPHAMHGSGLL